MPEPPKKRGRVCRKATLDGSPEALPNGGHCDPVEYWTRHDTWPPKFAEKDAKMDNPVSNKRTRSRSTSYTQGVKDGKNPIAYSRAHEKKMEEAGLIMAAYQDQATITDGSQGLCENILRAEYALPQGSLFEDGKFSKVLRRVQVRNEARVARDVTPLLVPSAELLDIDNYPGLENVAEEMQAEWTKCATLCGPRPKPDFAVGISSSAFTTDEKQKLQMNHTADCPNLFAESVYYPFLICEVKCSDGLIREAERQTMHSASIAVNAVIQLYKKISQAQDLNRKILAISVSHDASTVKIFGHFARIGDDKITFFRHPIYVSDFTVYDRWKAYKIIRGIYDHFFPRHLERITSALSKLPDRALESFTSELGLDSNAEEVDSQEAAKSASSSQQAGKFKKPSLPSTSMLQQENEKLRDQLLILLRQQQDQMEQQKAEQREQKEMMERQMEQQKAEQREQKEMMERQMEQQKAEQREQKEMMERQMEQQKAEQREQKEMMERQMEQQKAEQREQKEMMERQMEQQKAEQREQKEMMERQMEQMEQQMEQQKEIISLLKQSKI